MKLYHSSNMSVEHPDTKHSRPYLDFGRGFYLTSLYEQAIRSAQCARIIVCISEMFGVSLNEATDIYYNSETANLIEEGVSDLHCRSDKYLAEEVWREYQESK
jgi:hypothetical protein